MPSPDPELLLRRERQLEALCADEALQRARPPPRGGARRVSSASRRQSVSSSKNGGAKGLPKSDSTAASPATEWTLVTSSNSSRSSGGCRARGGEKARLISQRPFRSPHHHVSVPGLIGTGPVINACHGRAKGASCLLSSVAKSSGGTLGLKQILRALTRESAHPCTTA